ncbi:MAG: CHASE2 domain-containing protein [Proteobacteria bacterium]|nr:CHASE2 domain-containing protein [Pseudomonadota bacterium]MCP4918647.1 CHASE2 domain-containing protein [Pseudomonadota bacterium]
MSDLPALLQSVSAARDAGDAVREETAIGSLHRALREDPPDDPLMASSCLPYVIDEELREILQPVAAQAQPRSARAKAVVTDARGQGSVIEVVVELSPGGRGVWTVQPCAQETLLAAQLAVAAALGPDGSRYGVRWQVAGPAQRLRGASLGLALAIAARAAHMGRAVPPERAWTGAVELDGRVADVAGIPAKARAAAASSVVLTVPAGQGAGGLAEVATLEAAVAELFPVAPPTRRPPYELGLLLLAPLLGWLGALDFAEIGLRSVMVRALHGALPADDTVIVGLPPDADRQALRGAYSRVFWELADAGATAIVVDVLLLAETKHDAALALTIHELPIPVIAPLRVEDGGVQKPPPVLSNALVLGATEFERDLVFGKVRRAPVQLADGDAWHLAVLGLAAHLGATPDLHDTTLSIGVTRNPVREGRLYLAPVEPSPRIEWEGPYDAARGRVAFIGQLEGRTDRLRTSLGDRQGVELHAGLLEALARQGALRLGSPAWDALAALLAGLGTAAAAWRLVGWTRYLSLLVGATVLAILLGIAASGTLPALLPTVLATGVGLYVGRRVARVS